MRNLSFCFITVIFLTFPPFYAFSGTGTGAGGRGAAGNSKSGFDSARRDAPAPDRRSSSFRSGSEKRDTAVPQNDESRKTESLFKNPSSEDEGCFNPSTGWHTVPTPEQNEIINYRGTRKILIDEDLKVSRIKTETGSNGTATFEIFFNQEINPQSFTSSNLKINGKTADNDVKFFFSRKGDSVKIQIPAQDKDFSLSLSGIEAFDGEKVSELQLGNFSVN